MRNNDWHIWLIRSNKFADVKRYLDKHVKEVKEVLYPTYTKEFRTSSGAIKKKKVPLYSSYLFLRYKDVPEVFYKMVKCPFILRYLGKCLGENLKEVQTMRKVEEWNKDKQIKVGDTVSIDGGTLGGFNGEVFMVSGNKVYIYVDIFGRNVQTEVLIEDVTIVGKS
jgi:transcription antitermination factor NusG